MQQIRQSNRDAGRHRDYCRRLFIRSDGHHLAGIRQSPPGRDSTIHGNRNRVDSHYGDVGRYGRRRNDYSDWSLYRSGEGAQQLVLISATSTENPKISTVVYVNPKGPAPP